MLARPIQFSKNRRPAFQPNSPGAPSSRLTDPPGHSLSAAFRGTLLFYYSQLWLSTAFVTFPECAVSADASRGNDSVVRGSCPSGGVRLGSPGQPGDLGTTRRIRGGRRRQTNPKANLDITRRGRSCQPPRLLLLEGHITALSVSPESPARYPRSRCLTYGRPTGARISTSVADAAKSVKQPGRRACSPSVTLRANGARGHSSPTRAGVVRCPYFVSPRSAAAVRGTRVGLDPRPKKETPRCPLSRQQGV